MKISTWLALALMVAAVIAPASFGTGGAPSGAGRADGATDWPTFHGDAGRTGNSSGDGPSSNHVLWSNATGGNVYSTPVVAGDRAFIGSFDGYLYCFNATTGERHWRFSMGGTQSSPAVNEAGDRVFIGNSNRNVYCVNVASGLQAWTAQVDGGMDGSPLVLGGRVYVSTTTGSLHCLDAGTGGQGWRVAGAGGEASPAADDGRLFCVGNGQLRCLDPVTGAFLWNATVSEFYSSPTAAGGRVYLPGGDGSVSCYNASTGTRLWRTPTGWAESTSTAALSNGSVYVCVDSQTQNRGGLVKLDASDGSITWSYQVVGDPYVAPAVAGDRVYFSYARTVACVNASDHSVVWTYQAASADQYGICSSPALAGGNLYIGGVESKLFCFGQGEPNRPPRAAALSDPETVRETSVVLRWTQNADLDFDRYEVHRSLYPSFLPGPPTLVASPSSASTVSCNVSGLNHTTRYHFKVRTWDRGDPPMFNDSNEVWAVTATPNGAPAAVVLHPASDVTPFSARLAWSANADPDFARYELHRGTQPGFPLTSLSLVRSLPSRDQNSTTDDGLKPWTRFFFRVRIIDNGTPPLFNDSNEVELRTGNTPPSAVALDPPQMGATSAFLTWEQSADEDFAGYEVSCSEDPAFADCSTVSARVEARFTTDHFFEGLRLARTFHFKVRVHDEGGLFNDSNTMSGTTANTVPKAVIFSPLEGDTYDTRTPVDFSSRGTSDQDGDPLGYRWTSSVDGLLSDQPEFTRLLSVGNHRITLKVNDGSGHEVSTSVGLTVNRAPDRPPALAVSSHRNNDEVSGRVTFEGTAWDIDGNDTLVRVEARMDKGDWEDADGTANWSWEWNSSKVANGRHRVAFRANDGELDSPEVSFNVLVQNINLLPTVNITGPDTSRPFTLSAVITGTATDPDGRVERVELSLNGGAWFAVPGTASWSYSLDVSGLRNGAHYLQVRAFDGTDNSEPVRLDFSVRNPGPAPAPGDMGLLPLAAAGAIAAAVVGAVAYLALRRRGRAPPPPESPSRPGEELRPAP